MSAFCEKTQLKATSRLFQTASREIFSTKFGFLWEKFYYVYLAPRKDALIDIKNKSYYTVNVIFELIGAEIRWVWRIIKKIKKEDLW